MIAVSVDENGRLNTCTCRWNHDNGGNDSIMDPKQISEVIGMNFYQTFKPNNKWKELLDNYMRRLANGEDPNDVFDYCGDFCEGFAAVKLNGKSNFINTHGELLWKGDKWFDGWGDFCEGFAKVKLNRKWNFINTRGELLCNEWFDWCDDFDNGFAKVELNGRAFMIDTKGQLHNLNETKQRTLRLTESEFRKLIKESVRKTLYKRML